MKPSNKVKSRDKLAKNLLKFNYAVAFFFFGVLAIFKLIVPSTHGGWSDIPIVEYILISGFMLGIICGAGIYGFQAWTKNEEEYYHWLISLGLLRKSKFRLMSTFYSKGTYLWSARIISIIMLLFVCVFIILIPT